MASPSPVFHYQDWLGCVMHALPGNSHYREDALTIHGSEPPVGIISELDVTSTTSPGIDYYVISSEQNNKSE